MCKRYFQMSIVQDLFPILTMKVVSIFKMINENLFFR